MLRCSECKKLIVESTKYMDWLSLMSFLEFLYNEEYIEEATYVSMTDKLMTFKMYCFDHDEDK